MFGCSGLWLKHDQQQVDICEYLVTYPNVYTMAFVVVEDTSVKWTSSPRFSVTFISSVFMPQSRAFHGAKIVFPTGLVSFDDGFIITYGENDCVPNSFFVKERDLRSILFKPTLGNAPRLIDEENIILNDLATHQTNVKANRNAHYSWASPLAILTLGRDQGTFWFLDVFQHFFSLGAPVSLCHPSPTLLPTHMHMWRWTPSESYTRHVRHQQSNAPIASEICPEFNGRLISIPRTQLSLLLTFDLDADDLDRLINFNIPFTMVRMVRDPRDVIVSGYHRHRKCPANEAWLHMPGWTAEVFSSEIDTLRLISESDIEIDILHQTYCEMLSIVPTSLGLHLEAVVASHHWLDALACFSEMNASY